MLLFLQNLQCIKISLPQNTDITFDCKIRDTAINVSLQSSLASSMELLKTFEDDYLRVESIMDDLPAETRRAGVLKSQDSDCSCVCAMQGKTHHQESARLCLPTNQELWFSGKCVHYQY